MPSKRQLSCKASRRGAPWADDYPEKDATQA
jgi:hypothetical protein